MCPVGYKFLLCLCAPMCAYMRLYAPICAYFFYLFVLFYLLPVTSREFLDKIHPLAFSKLAFFLFSKKKSAVSVDALAKVSEIKFRLQSKVFFFLSDIAAVRTVEQGASQKNNTETASGAVPGMPGTGGPVRLRRSCFRASFTNFRRWTLAVLEGSAASPCRQLIAMRRAFPSWAGTRAKSRSHPNPSPPAPCSEKSAARDFF